MASFINKILGRDEDSEHSHSHSHKTDAKCESGTCSSSASGNEKCASKEECKTATYTSQQECKKANHDTCNHNSAVRTVQHEGVNIKSTISTEGSSTVSMANQQKLTDLVTKLGSTHTQIDEYAKKQTEKIDDQIQREIDSVVGRIRREQEQLLQKANEHTATIDTEYRAKLQSMVEEIDATKAKRIADIETELNNQQAGILQAARNEIDQLNQKAAKLKIDVLQSAQAKAAVDAKEITAQAATLGQASTIHQATGTTTIKTEVTGSATTKEIGGAAGAAHTATATEVATSGAKHASETKTIETHSSQSHDSKH